MSSRTDSRAAAGSTDALVRALLAARRDRRPAVAADWQDTLREPADAYRVQHEVAEALGWFDAQRPARHWKSGSAARTAELTHAPLPPDGVRSSPATFGDLHFNAPGVEAEIALRLGRTVTPQAAAGLTHETADAFVDAMAVSIEIVDSRWREATQAPPLLRLADSQSHGALVLGDWVPYAARDWAAQCCETRIGDAAPIERCGTHPLGEPAWLLPQWLKHLTQDGRSVPAGTVVTTGSWIGIVPVAAGQRVHVEFAGIGSAQARL